MSDLPLKLVSLQDLNLTNDYEETGETCQEVALGKARYFFEKCSQNLKGLQTFKVKNSIILADDSGIWVDALPGELGVESRRWGAGEKASDVEWLDYFLKKIEKVPAEKRTARFISAIALIIPQDLKGLQTFKVEIFEGIVEGTLTQTLEAPLKQGVPLSSIFKPIGSDKVFSAMTSAEKAYFSHRGKAVAKAKDFILPSLPLLLALVLIQ